MVSSTCSDALMNSPISNDPESEDRDRFSGADRMLESSLSMLLESMRVRVSGFFFNSKPPSSIVFIRAFVARSLR